MTEWFMMASWPPYIVGAGIGMLIWPSFMFSVTAPWSAKIGVGFKHQLQVKGALPRHWQLSGRSVWTYAFPSWIVPAVTTPENMQWRSGGYSSGVNL